jgi:peptidyl-prolyl cis-trans isomerase B (cyclophilin B)
MPKKPIWLKNIALLILIGSLILGGCTQEPTNSSHTSPSSDNLSTKPVESVTADNSSLEMYNNLPKLEGTAKVELVVGGSPIIIELDGNNAPITAGNFIDLVERGVYEGLAFHRVIKEPQPFVAQGGDPQGKNPNFPVSQMGTGGYIDPETGQRRFIPLEIQLEGQSEPTYNQAIGRQAGLSVPSVVLKHERGAVAMARSQAPDSASSQFYFALADLEFLDGDYAVFGRVVEGMDTVDGIEEGDRIESARVIEGAENLKRSKN